MSYLATCVLQEKYKENKKTYQTLNSKLNIDESLKVIDFLFVLLFLD